MFGVPVRICRARCAAAAKAINFGFIYGISGVRAGQPARHRARGSLRHIKKYFERFPGIRPTWTRPAVLRKHGYVRTLFGRKCHYPDIKAATPWRVSSTSAPRSTRWLQGHRRRHHPPRHDPDVRMRWRRKTVGADVAAVHDELICRSWPDGEVAATLPVVRHTMQDAPFPAVLLSVPLAGRCTGGEQLGRSALMATVRRVIVFVERA